MLEMMIQQHVFVINNKEKVDIIKARDATRAKLVNFREFLEKQIENLKKIE